MTPPNCLVNHESNSLNLETAKRLEYYYLNNCVEWIKARGLKTVCLQFPDALLKDSAIIALELEKLLGHKVYILGDTTCGSCCVDEIAADHIKADGIIHFGHACLNPTIKLPIFHVLPRCNIDIDVFIQSFCDYFDCDRNILFFYDVSYAHAIESIWKKLKEKNYNKIKLTLLNCKSNIDFTDKKSDDSDKKKIIIGRELLLNDNKFEDFVGFYLGDDNKTLASFALSIPVQNWYYCTGIIEEESIKMNINEFEVTKNPWLRRRRFLVEKLKDAKVIGIVVATLGIKNYLDVLDMIKSILKRKNIKSYIFSVGKPNPAKLANFAEVDAFVVIACPENEIFDSKDYYKPLCTPFEVELAFNDSREFSTNYCLDFRQLLPGGINYVEFKPTDQSDISLITGQLRNYTSESGDQTDTEKMKTLACKNDGTVAIGKAGADFLLNRSWQGLEQKLGETEIKTAEQGRRGLPVNYDTEPLINKT